MNGKDPQELIQKHREEQDTRSQLAKDALNWFLDDENVGQLYPRADVVDEISESLDITIRQANIAISATVGDIVDPVQQIPIDGTRYVGIVEYKLYQNEGAYGYVDIDDVLGKRKRVVCAKCVEDATHDADVTHATQGEGSTPQDASWKTLLNKLTAHYADSHTDGPQTVRPGASLLNGTTISGNITFHKGNDGAGSGLDADTVDGNKAADFASDNHDNTQHSTNFLSESQKTSSASELTDVSSDSNSSAHHSRYSDSEASSASPVQSVNNKTGDVSISSGTSLTRVKEEALAYDFIGV